jgi:hypothetical protein
MTSSNRPTPTRTRFVVIVRDRSGEKKGVLVPGTRNAPVAQPKR